MTKQTKPLIEIVGLKNNLGGQWVHKDVNLTVNKKEIIGIVGGSGSGKTVLLRSILMLRKPTAGSINVFGTEVTNCSIEQAFTVQHRWGVLFQHDALFSSLTVLENVQFPLRTFTTLSENLQKQLAILKISMAGLPMDAINKYPAELSGGMQKRAALARAIALDPELLFLDEPTAGLDPQSAGEFDELLLELRNGLGLTVIMVTHDLDSIWRVTDRVAFLGDGKVIAALPLPELIKQKNKLIQTYFSGPRGERSKEANCTSSNST